MHSLSLITTTALLLLSVNGTPVQKRSAGVIPIARRQLKDFTLADVRAEAIRLEGKYKARPKPSNSRVKRDVEALEPFDIHRRHIAPRNGTGSIPVSNNLDISKSMNLPNSILRLIISNHD